MSAMDLLTSPPSSSSVDAGRKPYKGFSRLPYGYHEVFNFRLVKNKLYNPNVVNQNKLKRVLLVELVDQVLFLPQQFAYNFEDSDEKVNELNTDGVKKFMFFGGKAPNK